MNYSIFTLKNTRDSVVVHTYRKDLDKATATALSAKCNSNANRTCKYVVVADARKDEFFVKVAELAEKRKAAYEPTKQRIDSRFNYAVEMWKNGYKCTDTLEFIHK